VAKAIGGARRGGGDYGGGGHGEDHKSCERKASPNGILKFSMVEVLLREASNNLCIWSGHYFFHKKMVK
jgi:hypothetical protein